MAFLPGMGNGTFGPQALSTTNSPSADIEFGDLDRVGLTDAVVANRSSNNVTIYYGVSGGAGPFSATANVTLATGVQPYSAAVGDVNGV